MSSSPTLRLHVRGLLRALPADLRERALAMRNPDGCYALLAHPDDFARTRVRATPTAGKSSTSLPGIGTFVPMDFAINPHVSANWDGELSPTNSETGAFQVFDYLPPAATLVQRFGRTNWGARLSAALEGANSDLQNAPGGPQFAPPPPVGTSLPLLASPCASAAGWTTLRVPYDFGSGGDEVDLAAAIQGIWRARWDLIAGPRAAGRGAVRQLPSTAVWDTILTNPILLARTEYHAPILHPLPLLRSRIPMRPLADLADLADLSEQLGCVGDHTTVPKDFERLSAQRAALYLGRQPSPHARAYLRTLGLVEARAQRVTSPSSRAPENRWVYSVRTPIGPRTLWGPQHALLVQIEAASREARAESEAARLDALQAGVTRQRGRPKGSKNIPTGRHVVARMIAGFGFPLPDNQLALMKLAYPEAARWLAASSLINPTIDGARFAPTLLPTPNAAGAPPSMLSWVNPVTLLLDHVHDYMAYEGARSGAHMDPHGVFYDGTGGADPGAPNAPNAPPTPRAAGRARHPAAFSGPVTLTGLDNPANVIPDPANPNTHVLAYVTMTLEFPADALRAALAPTPENIISLRLAIARRMPTPAMLTDPTPPECVHQLHTPDDSLLRAAGLAPGAVINGLYEVITPAPRQEDLDQQSASHTPKSI